MPEEMTLDYLRSFGTTEAANVVGWTAEIEEEVRAMDGEPTPLDLAAAVCTQAAIVGFCCAQGVPIGMALPELAAEAFEGLDHPTDSGPACIGYRCAAIVAEILRPLGDLPTL